MSIGETHGDIRESLHRLNYRWHCRANQHDPDVGQFALLGQLGTTTQPGR